MIPIEPEPEITPVGTSTMVLYYDGVKTDLKFLEQFCEQLQRNFLVQSNRTLEFVRIVNKTTQEVSDEGFRQALCALYVFDAGGFSRVQNRIDRPLFTELALKTGFWLLFLSFLSLAVVVCLLTFCGCESFLFFSTFLLFFSLFIDDRAAFVFFRNKDSTDIDIGDLPSKVGGQKHQVVLQRIDEEYQVAVNKEPVANFVTLLLSRATFEPVVTEEEKKEKEEKEEKTL